LAHADFQALLLGQLIGLHEHAEAGGVGAAGLFHEDVLAGLDRRFEMRGAEPGRRGQNGIVHTGHGQRLLIGIETAEALVLGHLEGLGRLLGRFREYVRHSDDFGICADRLGSVVEIPARAAAASADTDDHSPDRLCALAAENRRETRDGSRRGGHER
jgi:hypothetical protein